MLDHDVDIFICVLYLDHSNFMQNIQCKFHWPWRTKSMCISHTCSTFRKNLNSFFIVGTYIHIKRDPYRCCSHNHNIQSLQPSNLAHCVLFKKSNTKFARADCKVYKYVWLSCFEWKRLFSTSFDVVICMYDNSNHFLYRLLLAFKGFLLRRDFFVW